MLHWDLKFRNNFRLFITMQRCLQDPRNHINKMESFATIVNGLDVWGGGGGGGGLQPLRWLVRVYRSSHPRCFWPSTLFEKRVWRRCFPVNFVKFTRTPFLQITSGRLLLSQLIYQCSNETSLMWVNCSLNLRFFQTQLKNNSFFNKKEW